MDRDRGVTEHNITWDNIMEAIDSCGENRILTVDVIASCIEEGYGFAPSVSRVIAEEFKDYEDTKGCA